MRLPPRQRSDSSAGPGPVDFADTLRYCLLKGFHHELQLKRVSETKLDSLRLREKLSVPDIDIDIDIDIEEGLRLQLTA